VTDTTGWRAECNVALAFIVVLTGSIGVRTTLRCIAGSCFPRRSPVTASGIAQSPSSGPMAADAARSSRRLLHDKDSPWLVAGTV
jgi:hypothetical protein